ncbi:Peptidoglycan glycosyltransferase MrdB [Hydrogenovibrio crunogenus]|uniref:Peptidoglycan glycosyltransferase MrdB n=1 Tax=Hydrogenovibrio crunogenus TaxID=39765 RepID=A0A4P7P102_9GAMM|nr:rod shape-determining protein RodA [Hydrogenovibrio crunogenus]QBZ83666.1 Peptidoglycan glycosyltransferase MrdB [Hydrogenovibrio crunogenus]RUM92349.1 MAG: rod shape-determining protein RodA [Thiomicrospira sp.]
MKIDLPAREKVYRKNRGILVSLHLDGWLLLGIALLIVTGSLIVFSASGADQEVLSRHLVRVGFAFFLMLVFAQIPPNILKIYTPWVFGVGTLMLISVLLFGDIGKGAKRWLDFGFFRFQPSEVMKLALPMMIAWLFAHDSLPPPNKKMLIGLGLVGLIAGLIIVQPDLGTSILIAMSGLFVLFFAGLSWRWILSATGLVAASLPIVWNFYMYDYQKQRVLTFLDPESDPLGTGYHIIQSKIAIGSGGIEGKGFMGSTQAHLEFLPESTTDFIFSVLAEEFGLIGVTGLLLLYLFVIGRGLYIASQAQENFARLTAASLVMTLFVYVFVNIGMVSGLLPVVGLPLPLLSYGGSSLVTLMVSFGILMSIHTHKKLLTS